MTSTKTKVSAVSTPRQQPTKQSSFYQLAKLFFVVILSAQINGCFNIQLSGNDYPGEQKNRAVSKNNNEDHIRFLIPKDVSIPKNVKVLSCVLVDKGSVEGFKRYLASGKGREIYAIPYANYLPDQTNTVIAYQASDNSFWLIVVAGDGKGIECAAGKHVNVSFDNFKSAKDFLVWWLIFRAGRYDLWGDVFAFLSTHQNKQNYHQTVEELFSFADIFAEASESNLDWNFQSYPHHRRHREFHRSLSDVFQSLNDSQQSQINKQAWSDAVSVCIYISLLEAVENDNSISVTNLIDWIKASLEQQNTSNELKEILINLLKAFEKNKQSSI